MNIYSSVQEIKTVSKLFCTTNTWTFIVLYQKSKLYQNSFVPEILEHLLFCTRNQNCIKTLLYQKYLNIYSSVPEIKSVSKLFCTRNTWTFTLLFRVPGEIKRSGDLGGGRWSWTLNCAQKRSWVGRWRWAGQVGRLLLRVVQVVRQQLCNGHCLSDSVQHSSWKSNCAVHKSLGNGEGTPP